MLTTIHHWAVIEINQTIYHIISQKTNEKKIMLKKNITDKQVSLASHNQNLLEGIILKISL